MPAIIESPAQPSAQDVFKSVESFDTQTPKQVTPPEPPPEKPEADTQILTDKPEPEKPKPEAKATEKKSALDKMGAVKKPEVAKPEAKPNGVVVEEKPVDVGNTKQLREAYEKQKAEFASLKAELDKVRPDYEKIRKDFDLTRAELTELKAANLNPEERGRFDKLREIHATWELEQDKSYQEKVMAPIHQRIAKIHKVATEAKLDPVATEAVKNAMDLPDELDRSREIRRILKGADLEPDDFHDFYTSLTTVGRELNEKYYPEMEAKQKQALDIEQAARTKDKQEAEQAQVREKAEFQKERDFVHKHLTEQSLKHLMEETDLSVDGVTLAEALQGAEPADNARDRAYQSQAGAAMPFVIEYTNKLLAKIHELEQANQIRNGSSPSRSDALVKTTEAKRTPDDPNAVFKSVGSFGVH